MYIDPRSVSSTKPMSRRFNAYYRVARRIMYDRVSSTKPMSRRFNGIHGRSGTRCSGSLIHEADEQAFQCGLDRTDMSARPESHPRSR